MTDEINAYKLRITDFTFSEETPFIQRRVREVLELRAKYADSGHEENAEVEFEGETYRWEELAGHVASKDNIGRQVIKFLYDKCLEFRKLNNFPDFNRELLIHLDMLRDESDLDSSDVICLCSKRHLTLRESLEIILDDRPTEGVGHSDILLHGWESAVDRFYKEWEKKGDNIYY